MAGDSSRAGVVGHDDSDNRLLDVIFDLLANQRRRHVLGCLVDNTQAVALTDLVEDVSVRESERPLTEIPEEEVRIIHISLYHSHIPKLVDAGVVEYDQDRDLVRISETADLVERILFLIRDGGEEQ